MKRGRKGSDQSTEIIIGTASVYTVIKLDRKGRIVGSLNEELNKVRQLQPEILNQKEKSTDNASSNEADLDIFPQFQNDENNDLPDNSFGNEYWLPQGDDSNYPLFPLFY
ncbi:hypothetical protein M9Y10_036393 [Tritrichomonas musculus]|uniref:Uncharacterized protein n=1 Tax=Tritrichomonas musculus TaxID=1915356 RepID=A0ABR2GV98_9EUKA